MPKLATPGVLLSADTTIVSRSSGSDSKFDPGQNLDQEGDDAVPNPDAFEGKARKSFSGDVVAFAVRDAYSGVGLIFPNREGQRTPTSNPSATFMDRLGMTSHTW